MKIGKSTAEEAFATFQEKKIMTMNELMQLLNCSNRTVQRKLNKWGVFRSYNLNGKYYTSQCVPNFNRVGIWKYKNVFFSKYGNLKETVEGVVNQSQSGLNAIELSAIMGLPARKFLSHFVESLRLRREKYKGLYVYFSEDLDSFEKQQTCRNNALCLTTKQNLPSDADAVIILVEYIKHFGETTEQLAHRLRKKGNKIPIEIIRNLFSYHSLKKTLDIRPFEN